MLLKKKKIIDLLKDKVLKDLDAAKKAFRTTHDHATEGEMKAEGKYDTRSIEASYLAGAQKVRVHEIERELALLNEIHLDHPTNLVGVGCLVEIEFNKTVRPYFISPTTGGPILDIDGIPVVVISAFSPIGVEAIGLEVGDTFEVESANQTREYKIISIN